MSIPEWLEPGARVRKVGGWPRVKLDDGALGTVQSLDIDPVTGDLRWFLIIWDNHAEYTHGVHHYGWHANEGRVVPTQEGE